MFAYVGYAYDTLYYDPIRCIVKGKKPSTPTAIMNSNSTHRLLRRSQNQVGRHEQKQQETIDDDKDGIGNINPNDDDDGIGNTNKNIIHTMTTSVMSKVRNNYNIRKSYGTIIRSTTRNESERNHNDNDDDDEKEKEKDITTIYQDQVDADTDADFDVDDYNEYDASIVNATYTTNNHHSRHKKSNSSSTSVLLRKSIIGVFYAVIVILVVGIGTFLRNKNNSNNNNSITSAISNDQTIANGNNALTIKTSRVDIPGFNFDSLFGGGIKKKTPASQLQSPQSSMARSILLVLHGEATPENPTVNDIDRQLTSKGMREAEGLGIYLKEHQIPEPDWIFSSPSERTAYTTELIRRNWASNAPVAFEEILYTLAFNDYFAFVAGLNYNYRRVMIVGHNPAILNTAQKLMRTHGIEDFPLCGFMEIR